MIEAAAAAGAGDRDALILETLMAFKRAGATGVLTYHALDAARLIARLMHRTSCASELERAARGDAPAGAGRRRSPGAWRAGARPCARLSRPGRDCADQPAAGPRCSPSGSIRNSPRRAAIRRECSTMSPSASTGPASRPRQPALHGLYPGRRRCSIPRSATCSRRRRTNIPASPRPAPARCGIENACIALAGRGHRLSRGRGGDADLGRQHRQSDRHRRRPRGARSATAAARSTRPASPIIASTRRCTSPGAAARRGG